MNDYIMRLIARSLGLVEVVSPRLASLYEPLSSDTWNKFDFELQEVHSQERSQEDLFKQFDYDSRDREDPRDSIPKEEPMGDQDLGSLNLPLLDQPVARSFKRERLLKEGVIKRPSRSSLGENALNRCQSPTIKRVLKRELADERGSAKGRMQKGQSGMVHGIGSMPSKAESGDAYERGKDILRISSSSEPLSSAPLPLTNLEKENIPTGLEAETLSVAAEKRLDEKQSNRSTGLDPSSKGRFSDRRAVEEKREIVPEDALRPSTKDAPEEIKTQFLPSIDISHQSERDSSFSGEFGEKEIQLSGESSESKGIDVFERDGIVRDIAGLEPSTELIKTRYIELGINGNEQRIHSKTTSLSQDEPNSAGKIRSSSPLIIKPLESSKHAIIGSDQTDNYASIKGEFTAEALEDSTRHSIDPMTSDKDGLMGLNRITSSNQKNVAEEDEVFRESASSSLVPGISKRKTLYAVSSPAKLPENPQLAEKDMGRTAKEVSSEMPPSPHLLRSYYEAEQHPRPQRSKDLKKASLESEYLNGLDKKIDKKKHRSSAANGEAKINESPKDALTVASQNQMSRTLKTELPLMLPSQISLPEDQLWEAKRNETEKNIEGPPILATGPKHLFTFRPSISRDPAESKSIQPWASGEQSKSGHRSIEPQIADQSPSIKVTIGRVSVHATQVAPPARKDPPSSLPQKLSLNDYLKMRDEGRI